jgi:DNA-directed RNA polymerase subunit RPC12/RpoP
MVFEYKCPICKIIFEKDASPKDEKALKETKCPICDGKALRKFSRVNFGDIGSTGATKGE